MSREKAITDCIYFITGGCKWVSEMRDGRDESLRLRVGGCGGVIIVGCG